MGLTGGGGIRGIWPSWGSLALLSGGTVFAGTDWFPSCCLPTLWLGAGMGCSLLGIYPVFPTHVRFLCSNGSSSSVTCGGLNPSGTPLMEVMGERIILYLKEEERKKMKTNEK